MSTHTHSQYVEICIGQSGSMEVEVAVTYTFIPACPETGPTYACGGTPAEPAYVDDIDFKVFAINWQRASRGAELQVPSWLSDFIRDAIDEDALIENAAEDLEEV